jgi:hypothetical protein
MMETLVRNYKLKEASFKNEERKDKVNEGTCN